MKAKPRTCKECKKKFKPRYSTIQPVCSVRCAILHSKKIERQKDKKRTIELRKKLETHSDHEEKLQKVVNAIAREIDKYMPCISSRRTKGKMNGGHYISVGANSSIRFNLHNIHKQTFSDNHFKSSNRDGYDVGLIDRYGHKYFDMVKYGLGRKYRDVKLTKEELKVAIKKAREVLKEFTDQDHCPGARFLPDDLMKMRDYANKKIGIYK